MLWLYLASFSVLHQMKQTGNIPCTYVNSTYTCFSCSFLLPISRLGKIKVWVVVSRLSNSCNYWTSHLHSLQFYPSRLSYLKTPESVIVGAGVSYLCKITTSRAPAASQITFSSFDVFLFPPQNSRKCRCGVLVVCSIHAHAQHLMHLRQSDLRVFSFDFPWHFKVRENEIVGGGIGCQIQSLQFYPSHFLPQNSGKCNCRGWGVIFVQNYNISCTCGKSNYIFFLCRFPFPTSRHETMSVWGVGSLFNSCTCSTSHAPAAIWFACFQFLFSMSHFKVRENEIVGGGIGCQIQSLQFYPSQFLPQNSGIYIYICNCRTGGVIFLQICNISCTCGKSNYIFFLCRFPFPTSKHEKMYVWGVGTFSGVLR